LLPAPNVSQRGGAGATFRPGERAAPRLNQRQVRELLPPPLLSALLLRQLRFASATL
jgi:hypothetical protein